MARTKPAVRPQIDAEICAKIGKIMEKERFRGSFAAYVEQILDKFADGLLVERLEEGTQDVHATKVRRVTVGEQRKTA